MAIDIMQMLFQVLRVQDLAYKYTNTVDQFLYLVFFPSLLVIAIVYLFMDKIFKNQVKLGFLFTIAFYIFVVVYPPNSRIGIYTAIAPLGELWFLIVAVLAVLWFLFGYSTGYGGRLPGIRGGGALGSIIRRRSTKESLDTQIKILRGILANMRRGSPDKLADYIREFRPAFQEASNMADELKVAGFHVDSSSKKLQQILTDFEQLEKSYQRKGGFRRAA